MPEGSLRGFQGTAGNQVRGPGKGRWSWGPWGAGQCVRPVKASGPRIGENIVPTKQISLYNLAHQLFTTLALLIKAFPCREY